MYKGNIKKLYDYTMYILIKVFLRRVGVGGVIVAVATIRRCSSRIDIVIVFHQLLFSYHSHIPSPPTIRHNN